MAAKKKGKKGKAKGTKKKAKKKAKKETKAKKVRCAATMKDPKTGRKRKCKNYVTGRSKFCAVHKK